jgi:dTDP-4-dehydrorhamnose reductase
MGKVKVIVFGASGQLGGDLVRVLNKKGEDLGFEIETLALTKNQVDVRNKQKVKDVIFSFKPDFVFNATGWNDVDGAEKPDM